MRTLPTLAALALVAAPAHARQDLPVVRSTVNVLSIRDGAELRAGSWTLAPEANPDVYEAALVRGRPHRVTFLTDVDSIGFLVEVGKHYDFVVERGGVRHLTRIVGTRHTPAAEFDEAYRRANRGTTHVEVPEAYELVNVAIAMTPTAIADPGLIYKEGPYYAAVRQWFDRHAGHPAVAMLDSALRRNQGSYFTLKMNGRAFDFDRRGRLVRSAVYDRTGFTGERSNALAPFAARLDDFARATSFRAFYARHRPVYDAQVAFYRDTADIAAMRRWLERQFPGQRPYDSFRIVFSPLVAYNQSVTWLESNGFKELQPHVNFPYAADLAARAGLGGLTDSAAKVYRGNIVFTEINHGYINPEADGHAARVARAIADRNFWVDSAKGPGYYGGNAAFNEYMNWVLVNVRYVDVAPAGERAAMTDAVERMMVRRGFPRFPAFSRWLTARYAARRPGETVASLYPEIIGWFERRGG
jgi:hypothetical protein